MIGQKADLVRIGLYVDALEDLSIDQLRHGFRMARVNMGEYLPSVGRVREACESWQRREASSLPADPPPQAKVTPEEFARWLDEGRQVQCRRIAQLEADPKWRDMRDRLVRSPRPK